MNNSAHLLYEDTQRELIEDISQSIRTYSMKETIDCLIEGIEINQERYPDDSENEKDCDLIKEFLEAVSGAAEDLAEDATTGLGCRQIRRRARDKFLIAIADIRVN